MFNAPEGQVSTHLPHFVQFFFENVGFLAMVSPAAL
jgi:hypothetical protein